LIDIVIPVYGGARETRRCIESVLATASAGSAEIVVVNDASPEAALVAYVQQLAADHRITLLANERNLGFVQSVNRGMALHDDRDVVLLNSDTEVANDWLERLRAAAHRADDIATATPFSNNATICTYPFEGWGGPVPGTLGLAELDRLFARTNTALALDIPTAVGFCMYIRRQPLRALGAFDAGRFGRGYGEENDFCMRALKAGWRHVLAADVFVFHEGAVSFSGSRFELMRTATEALVAAHPDYPGRVHEFIVADPAAPLRAAVDLARTARGEQEARHVLEERREEQRHWTLRARELEQAVAELDRHLRDVHAGLDEAKRLVADREERLGRTDTALTEAQSIVAHLNEEVARLRAAFVQAEKLALERDAELGRLRALPMWKYYLNVAERMAKA
jgi:GT2 family glycosyltransferase